MDFEKFAPDLLFVRFRVGGDEDALIFNSKRLPDELGGLPRACRSYDELIRPHHLAIASRIYFG